MGISSSSGIGSSPGVLGSSEVADGPKKPNVSLFSMLEIPLSIVSGYFSSALPLNSCLASSKACVLDLIKVFFEVCGGRLGVHGVCVDCTDKKLSAPMSFT